MWEVVKTGMATLIMHYGDMLKAGEASTVLFELQNSVRRHWHGPVEPHALLISLGDQLREKWNRDNMAVTTRASCFPEIKPVVHLWQKTDQKMDGVISNQSRMEVHIAGLEQMQASILANQTTILNNQAQILELIRGGMTQPGAPTRQEKETVNSEDGAGPSTPAPSGNAVALQATASGAGHHAPPSSSSSAGHGSKNALIGPPLQGMHTCVRACVRVCVRAYVRACVRACVHTCVRACVRVCVNPKP
jgi:hypothetical protein